LSSSEQRGFVFAITFIIVFAGLIAAIPVGLQGQGGTADVPLPVDPSLLTGFAESENWTESDCAGGIKSYEYSLGGFNWISTYQGVSIGFDVSRKVRWLGIVWLGAVKLTDFVLKNGTSRGWKVTFDELEGDTENGTIFYNLEYQESGNNAGGFIFYWNTTLHPDPEDAWNADNLTLIHGIGLDSTATANVGFLCSYNCRTSRFL